MLLSLLAFALVFTFIAVAHELGHFIWAKKAGIKVYEFGLGFGPRLFAFKWQGTDFSLNLIPILAFVRIAGEGSDEEDQKTPPDQLFTNKTPGQKFRALVAGPGFNIAAAFILLFFIFTVFGVPEKLSNKIEVVNKNSPAAAAGLRAGDRLIAINGKNYENLEEAIAFIHQSDGQQLRLSIERNGSLIFVDATPKFNNKLKVALLGFSLAPTYKFVNPLSALWLAAQQTASLVLVIFVVLGKLLTGGLSLFDLAGPVGIAQISGRYAQSGWLALLNFTAFISVNVGVLNLLPLPALDGGRLVFVLLEVLRKKAVPKELENKINSWGMVALLSLMLLVTINDLFRLFR